MASRILALSLRTVNSSLIPRGACGAHSASVSPIGNREVVCFGRNGIYNYLDRVDFPIPAVRFKETTPDIQALRQKEKGDWKNLSKEEKKALYRASFCSTFAEMEAPTGEWKFILGWGLIVVSLSIWMYVAVKLFVLPPLPETFSEERQKAQLKRMIALEVNDIRGLTSNWDREKGEWKK